MKTKQIGRLKARKLLLESNNEFVTATFTDKKGKKRIINGQILKDQPMSVLGYISVKDAAQAKKGKPAIRMINLQTLSKLNLNNKKYKIG